MGLPYLDGASYNFTTKSSIAADIAAIIVTQLKNGSIVAVPAKRTSNGTRTSQTVSGTLSGPGEVVAATVYWGGQGISPTQPGQTFVQLTVEPDPAIGGSGSGMMLVSDYMYLGNYPAWPGGTLRGYREGKGNMVVRAGTNPAAGAEIADTVPANATWLLRAIEVVLITDGTVANRNTNFFVDDAGTTVTRALLLTDTTNQTATQTRTHGFYPGTDNDSTASVSVTDTVTILAKYPMSLQNGVLLFSGSNLRTVTTGIVAGDDYGAPRYWVEEWISGNP